VTPKFRNQRACPENADAVAIGHSQPTPPVFIAIAGDDRMLAILAGAKSRGNQPRSKTTHARPVANFIYYPFVKLLFDFGYARAHALDVRLLCASRTGQQQKSPLPASFTTKRLAIVLPLYSAIRSFAIPKPVSRGPSHSEAVFRAAKLQKTR
jgi:hypothetical protein